MSARRGEVFDGFGKHEKSSDGSESALNEREIRGHGKEAIAGRLELAHLLAAGGDQLIKHGFAALHLEGFITIVGHEDRCIFIEDCREQQAVERTAKGHKQSPEIGQWDKPTDPTIEEASLVGRNASRATCGLMNGWTGHFNGAGAGKPIARNISASSLAAGLGAVSSFSPKNSELAPARKHSTCNSRLMRSRPALRRTRAFGNAIRVVAIKRTSWIESTGAASWSGVPWIGDRQLMGMLSGGGSRAASSARSDSRSSSLSPIPKMPPQQTEMPARPTARSVWRRSS